MRKIAFVILAAVFLMAQVLPAWAAETYAPTYNHRGNIGTSGRIWQNAYFDNIIGNGTNATQYGFKRYVVSKTSSYSLTAADCGKVFNNQGATAAVVFDLPAVTSSTYQGCYYTFVVGTAKSVRIQPDTTDIILGATSAAGEKLGNATVGNSVTLTATSASEWTPTSIYGTWGDEGA